MASVLEQPPSTKTHILRLFAMSGIWKFHTKANDYSGFIPSDLRFFSGRFRCKPLSNDWEVPPAESAGKSKPLADFASWVTLAPVVSERARDLIEDLAGPDVEFLQFHKLRKRSYFVLNVLRCEDYLDRKRSSLSQFQERFIFKTDLPRTIPSIFKCPELWGEIFVSSAFAEMMVTNTLTGAALADPGEPTLPLILANAEINRYPGLTS